MQTEPSRSCRSSGSRRTLPRSPASR
jgi:hypothetical protein